MKNKVSPGLGEKGFPDGGEVKDSGNAHRSKRLITIEPVVALYFMVMNPANPLVQQFLYSEIAAQKNYTVNGDDDGSYCISLNLTDEEERVQEQVQAETADYLMFLEIAETLPSLVTALIMGPLSDVVGRKPALVLPLIGNIVRCLSIMSIQLFEWPLFLSIVGTAIDGLLGGPATFISTAYAYMADMSTSEKRSLKMSILHACFSVSGAVAQIYMGYFIESAGFLYPYVLLVSMNALNLLYVIAVLPESLSRRHGVPLVSCDQLRATARTWIFPTYKYNRWKMYFCLCNFIAYGVIWTNRNILINLYSMNSPLCWGSIYIGFFSAYLAIVNHFGSILLTIVLVKHLAEVGLTILGSVSGAASMVLMSVSSAAWMMALVPIIGCASEVIAPMTRSILSGLVSPEEQGSLFSGLAIVERMSSVLGSIIFNNIYAATLDFYSGFVFIMLALVYLVTFLSMIYYGWRQRKEIASVTIDGSQKDHGITELPEKIVRLEGADDKQPRHETQSKGFAS